MMKKTICMLLSVMLILAGSFSALSEGIMKAGGWNAAEDPAVTEEARAVFDKALDGFVGVMYEPMALLGTQVVAGLNYCLLCKATTVTLEPRTFYALVYVWGAPDGTAQLLDIQEINMGLSPVDDYEDSQNPAVNLAGCYQDEVSQRAVMYIDPLGECYAGVTIIWGNSADETVEWSFNGLCDDNAASITYIEGEKRIYTYDEDGNETITEVYSDGEGQVLVNEDGTLRWIDSKEDAGKDCVFVWAEIPEQEPDEE